jgi:hypothetical protein
MSESGTSSCSFLVLRKTRRAVRVGGHLGSPSMGDPRLHPKTAPIIFCAGPHFRHEPETVQVRLLIKRTTIIGGRP